MARLTTVCPGCAESLEVSRLSCPGCSMQLEGRFELPPLLRLAREDLEFVVEFVRCSGSLKELGHLLGQSYPTVRNRLNDIIQRLQSKESTTQDEQKKILDAIARGELTVSEASEKLKELK